MQEQGRQPEMQSVAYLGSSLACNTFGPACWQKAGAFFQSANSPLPSPDRLVNERFLDAMTVLSFWGAGRSPSRKEAGPERGAPAMLPAPAVGRLPAQLQRRTAQDMTLRDLVSDW